MLTLPYLRSLLNPPFLLLKSIKIKIMEIKNQNTIRGTPVILDQKIKVAIDRISRMKDDSGRAGCTYGDTDYDSLSAVYGYNQAIDHVVSTLKEINAK